MWFPQFLYLRYTPRPPMVVSYHCKCYLVKLSKTVYMQRKSRLDSSWTHLPHCLISKEAEYFHHWCIGFHINQWCTVQPLFEFSCFLIFKKNHISYKLLHTKREKNGQVKCNETKINRWHTCMLPTEDDLSSTASGFRSNAWHMLTMIWIRKYVSDTSTWSSFLWKCNKTLYSLKLACRHSVNSKYCWGSRVLDKRSALWKLEGTSCL